MQKIFTSTILTMLIPAAFGATPATQCPAGYITIREPNAIIGYQYCESIDSIIPTEIEKPIYSCLDDTPGPVCTMFAPKGKTFTDETGEYQFDAPCALE